MRLFVGHTDTDCGILTPSTFFIWKDGEMLLLDVFRGTDEFFRRSARLLTKKSYFTQIAMKDVFRDTEGFGDVFRGGAGFFQGRT